MDLFLDRLSLKLTQRHLLFYSYELFFLFSFLKVTYASNLYIIVGLLNLILCIRFCKFSPFLVFYVLSYLFLISFYVCTLPFIDLFRILKTFIVAFPFISIYWFKDKIFPLSKLFYYFIYINGLLVLIDFILFFTLKRTIMSFDSTGFLPRPCGLIEDSNFYCYLVVVYCSYYYYTYNKILKFPIMTVFLSGSLSAILLLIMLRFFMLFKKTGGFFKYLLIVCCGLIFISYLVFVLYTPEILGFIESADVSELLKIKLISMSRRFQAQYDAMTIFLNSPNILVGLGAGFVRTITAGGMNLHNTYLQLLIESGLMNFTLVILIIFRSAFKINNIRYTILFLLIFLLGNMLEVYYFPLLSFVYYLSFIKRRELQHEI